MAEEKPKTRRGRKGKYADWLTPEGLTLIEGWAREGLSDEQISHNMGIVPKTLYEWMNKYSDISKSVKKGKEVADFEVENALYKSAMGYEYEEVKQYIKDMGNGKQEKRIEKTMKHIAPNTTAQIFWLKNRKRDKWNDRQHIEHGGSISIEDKSGVIDKYLSEEDED